MSLYEVRNGWTGESYVRCYVWAASKAKALAQAEASYSKKRERPEYAEHLYAKLLFSADSPAFATVPSDCGWEVPG